jgi:hypothetical protein
MLAASSLLGVHGQERGVLLRQRGGKPAEMRHSAAQCGHHVAKNRQHRLCRAGAEADRRARRRAEREVRRARASREQPRGSVAAPIGPFSIVSDFVAGR